MGFSLSVRPQLTAGHASNECFDTGHCVGWEATRVTGVGGLKLTLRRYSAALDVVG